MRERKVSLPVLLICVVLSAVLSVAIVLCLVPNSLRGYFTESDSLGKYHEIQSLIEKYYVDDISDEQLGDGIALGAVYSLEDKYSAYYTAEQYNVVLDGNEGLEAGVGITVVQHPDNGNIYVVNVSVDSPADVAGVKAGDLIIKVGGKTVTELGFTEAVNAIRGEIDTKCEVELQRGDKTLKIEIKRGRFVSTSVFSHMIGDLCYIQITDFNTATVVQFEDALKSAQESNATGLIFDVRGNSGGTLDSVEKMLDMLLPKGDLVSATYKNGVKKVLFSSDANEIDLPMTVLVDGNTASAAELFAASIRDFEKGKLIGTTTYGKGVMQRTFGLSDGSAVRLTIAYFNPPSGVNFNGVGIEPDVEVKLTEEEQKYQFLLNDETDPVITEAVKMLKNS